MVEDMVHPRGYSKKMKFFFLTLVSVVALVCSLSFLGISEQTSKFNQISSFLDPTFNAVDDGTQALHQNEEETPVDTEDMESPGLDASNSSCSKENAVLRVFVYDLPPEFHFGMLDWQPGGSPSVWPSNYSNFPRYPGGLNLQHSVEYWLITDLLSSNMPGRKSPCTAFRVKNPNEADVFFVPFFSSLSYNRHSKVDVPGLKSTNDVLQEKLVWFLRRQDAWRTARGKNHVIMMHHPNSMNVARDQLRSAMFIVADFGRYSPLTGNVEKDIVAPYKHVLPTFVKDTSTFENRKTLLYFQGAIFRKDGGYIRQELYSLLQNEQGVHFAFGNAQRDGIRSATLGMRSSKFCLNIAGDTPSSNRLFDAIASHCVPVIISDEIELPYEDVLDYTEFSVFVHSNDALKKGFLIKLLRSIQKEEWTSMRDRLIAISHHFEYQYPSQKDDAVQMIWKAVARKLPPVNLSLHKEKRYSRSRLAKRDRLPKFQ